MAIVELYTVVEITNSVIEDKTSIKIFQSVHTISFD